jgi:hypothetical protein
MNEYIEIQWKDFTETKTAQKFKIVITNLELFKSVSFQVLIYDINDNHIKTECFCLEGQEYQLWSSDDSYIVNYATYKLGLQKK